MVRLVIEEADSRSSSRHFSNCKALADYLCTNGYTKCEAEYLVRCGVLMCRGHILRLEMDAFYAQEAKWLASREVPLCEFDADDAKFLHQIGVAL